MYFYRKQFWKILIVTFFRAALYFQSSAMSCLMRKTGGRMRRKVLGGAQTRTKRTNSTMRRTLGGVRTRIALLLLQHPGHFKGTRWIDLDPFLEPLYDFMMRLLMSYFTITFYRQPHVCPPWWTRRMLAKILL